MFCSILTVTRTGRHASVAHPSTKPHANLLSNSLAISSVETEREDNG